MTRRRLSQWGALAVILVLANTAFAQETERCAPIAGGSDTLADLEPYARLHFIQKHVDPDARNVRIWAWTFAAAYSALLIESGVRLDLARTHGDKVDEIVSTSATAFGLIVLAIMPPAVLRDQSRLTRIVHDYGQGDRCASLAAAEALLIRDAKSEVFGKGPLVSMGNLVFNFTLGAIVGAVLHRWTTGMIVGASGAAAGELQQLTTITHLKKTLDRYKTGDLSDTRDAPPRVTWTIVPHLSKDNLGAGLGLTF